MSQGGDEGALASPLTVDATSLHGRDLEGLVRVTLELLAGCYITAPQGGTGWGRAPLTSLLLVISSLQVSIPAIESPVPYTD